MTAVWLKSRSQTLLAWTVALVCMACGAWWQLSAVSSQHVAVGTLTDSSYVVRLYDRERTVRGDPFRWTPARGGALRFWSLPPEVPAVLSLDLHRPSPATITLYAGDREFRFDVEPGRRTYSLLIAPGNQRIALTVSPELAVAGENRSLGVALLRALLVRAAPLRWSDVIATLLLAPFFPLALLGLSWIDTVSSWRYQLILTPLMLAVVIGAGLVWPVWRLEIVWLAVHLSLFTVMSVVIYRFGRRWIVLRLRNDRTFIAIMFSAGILAILLTFIPIVLSDGIGYYAYARAIVYRGDLMMDETFAELYGPFPVADTGLLANPWSVGPAVIWTGPLMLYRLLFGGNGHEIGAYATVCLVSALAGLGTMIVAYCCARRWFSPAASALGALTAFYGSTLWFYSMREGSFAHALSAFACASALLAWLRVTERPSLGRWVVLGAAAGMMALIYWATALLLIAPMIGIAYRAWIVRNDRQQLVRLFSGCMAAGLAALIVFSPQMIVWFLIYGSPLVKPPGTPYVVWNDPHIVDLFTARFGLARWSPAAMIGLFGLLLLMRRNPIAGGAFLVAAMVYIVYNGLLSDWHGSGAFGTRRLTSLAAWYALGLAAITEALIRRKRALLALGGALVCNGWMLMLMMRAALKGFPNGTSLSALNQMSTTDLYLARGVFPTSDISAFLHTGFVWDTLATAPPDFSVRILTFLACWTALALWAFWRMAVSDLRSCTVCAPEMHEAGSLARI